MTTTVRYNDSPYDRKCFHPEGPYQIRRVIMDSPYHGGPETTWVVRDPVTTKILASRETEAQARQAAREMAERLIAA